MRTGWHQPPATANPSRPSLMTRTGMSPGKAETEKLLSSSIPGTRRCRWEYLSQAMNLPARKTPGVGEIISPGSTTLILPGSSMMPCDRIRNFGCISPTGYINTSTTGEHSPWRVFRPDGTNLSQRSAHPSLLNLPGGDGIAGVETGEPLTREILNGFRLWTGCALNSS